MIDLLTAFGKLFLVIILSLLGMLLVRRKVAVSNLESHNDVAGFVYSVVGVVYAVLMAFMFYVVYVQYQTAQSRIEKEAALMGDMYRVSSNLQEPTRSEVLKALKDYARIMIEKEFPEMVNGKFHEQTKLEHDKLWDLFYRYQPKDERDKIWFEKSLSTLIIFADAKRDRMVSVKQSLPAFMWFVLYAGGFLLIIYSYFFGTPNVWSQALIVIFLAATVALVLLLISDLDRPFTGPIRVSPEPFRLFLNYFK
jgi:hypothetical protein